jgi:hypothetical protein
MPIIICTAQSGHQSGHQFERQKVEQGAKMTVYRAKTIAGICPNPLQAKFQRPRRFKLQAIPN